MPQGTTNQLTMPIKVLSFDNGPPGMEIEKRIYKIIFS